MNIYLDIDGVLLANDRQAARHVDAFVDACIASGADLYWLTTWCGGEDNQTASWLSHSDMNSATIAKLLQHCKSTNWKTAKTEAIDFSVPFLWFDDDLYAEERADLEKHNALDSWVEVNLGKDPDMLAQLLHCL